MGRLTGLITGLMLWLVSFVTPSSATDFAKPGPFAVGRQEFTIPDTTSSRAIPFVIWYPAAAAPDPNAKVLDSTKDAPAATTGPYPLVVVIHGLAGTGSMFGPVAQYFASYGIVVAAANFDDDVDPWIRKLPSVNWPPLRKLYVRPADVVRLIDHVETLNAPGGKLAGVIDTSHIGVWGMSSGGTTAFQAAGAQLDLKAMDDWCAQHKTEYEAIYETCQFVGTEHILAQQYGIADPFAGPLPALWDKRVAALVAVAPGGELHAFGDKGIAAVNVPALIMVTADDNVVSPEYNGLWAYGGIGSQTKTLAIFDHGGHSWLMKSAPHLANSTALATAFFLAILKGNKDARAALMPQAVSSPGVMYKTTLH